MRRVKNRPFNKFDSHVSCDRAHPYDDWTIGHEINSLQNIGKWEASGKRLAQGFEVEARANISPTLNDRKKNKMTYEKRADLLESLQPKNFP